MAYSSGGAVSRVSSPLKSMVITDLTLGTEAVRTAISTKFPSPADGEAIDRISYARSVSSLFD